MDETKKKAALRAGSIILVILAVLTAIEFVFGSLAGGWWAPLLLLALVKAFFVIRDYMHLPRLFAAEEENHS